MRLLVLMTLAGWALHADPALVWLGDMTVCNYSACGTAPGTATGMETSVGSNSHDSNYFAYRQFSVTAPGNFMLSNVVDANASSFLCDPIGNCGAPGVSVSFTAETIVLFPPIFTGQSLSGSVDSGPGFPGQQFFQVGFSQNSNGSFFLDLGTYYLKQQFDITTSGVYTYTHANFTTDLVSTPEPRWSSLMLIGMAGLAYARRCRH